MRSKLKRSKLKIGVICGSVLIGFCSLSAVVNQMTSNPIAYETRIQTSMLSQEIAYSTNPPGLLFVVR